MIRKTLNYGPDSNCTFTGRNGTFNQVGLTIATYGKIVWLIPHSRRGEARAEIQIAVKDLPQLIQSLTEIHQEVTEWNYSEQP